MADAETVVYAASNRIEMLSVNSREPRICVARQRRIPTTRAPSPSISPKTDERVDFKSHDREQRASIWAIPLAGGRPRMLVRFND